MKLAYNLINCVIFPFLMYLTYARVIIFCTIE